MRDARKPAPHQQCILVTDLNLVCLVPKRGLRTSPHHHLAELMRASPQNKECDSFEWPPRTLSSSLAVTNFLGKTNRSVFINTLNGQLNACCDVCTEEVKDISQAARKHVQERESRLPWKRATVCTQKRPLAQG